MTAAFAASGIDGDGFAFIGFLPRTSSGLNARPRRGGHVGRAADRVRGSGRLPKTLVALAARDPDRRVVVCRELTKLHEEVERGTATEVAARFTDPPPGEVTIVLAAGRLGPPAGRRRANCTTRSCSCGIPASAPRRASEVAALLPACRGASSTSGSPATRTAAVAGRRRLPPIARNAPCNWAATASPPEPPAAVAAALRPPVPCARELLRHDPHLLREREPHLGHAYTTIAADIAARHMRQRGEDVFFLTGTDEHGRRWRAARPPRGIEPKEFCDRSRGSFRQLARDVDATNDFFIRTSDPEHEASSRRSSSDPRSGDVYEGVYAGLYCTSCEAFYTEAELVDGICPIHGTRPEWVEEKNWFFRLSAYQERLPRSTRNGRSSSCRGLRYNEARAFIAGGPEGHLALARLDRVGRAGAVGARPDDLRLDRRAHQLHSALTYARPGEDLTERYWPARWQLMAKDILKFHAVIWPAMLIGRLRAAAAAPHPRLPDGARGRRCRSPSATCSTRSR